MIKRGSLVLVEAWGKRRPAIVLAMHADGTLAIIVGTTKPPREGDPAAIKVEPFTREGRATWLSKRAPSVEEAVRPAFRSSLSK